jgi:arylsulfatase
MELACAMLAAAAALGLLPAASHAQDKAATPSTLPRPDFRFPGHVGRTYLDSDPAQFPQPVRAPQGRRTSW